jgi:mono/diheme cytochrome c family protein
MQKQAKAAGVTVANCQHCHGEKLPKKGASTLNDAGKWLVAEKEKRKAKEVDGSWLKDYKPAPAK